MITAYNADYTVDYSAIREIAAYYLEKGCDGVFSVCQSSEMFYLSLDERVKIASTVVEVFKKAGKNVVVSGHISDSFESQVYELTAMSETGADSVVLISNKLDIMNEGDEEWIKNCEKLISRLPQQVTLGIYECPHPYKRLLTDHIIDWCADTGRFSFIKDTCCDVKMLESRLTQLSNFAKLGGRSIKLYNANAQTLLYTLRLGAAGYSGVMANFHPELYAWLCKNPEHEKAETVASILSMAAFTESMSYPVTAKYHMNLEGIKMTELTRNPSKPVLTEYNRHIVRDMRALASTVYNTYCI
ncbi:MAG: dihydrodipicolinate synthase family protein [Clostridiales bacterium]|nr:dihydrodipicolinate synthase family protein [Clostridiales bacterium]